MSTLLKPTEMLNACLYCVGYLWYKFKSFPHFCALLPKSQNTSIQTKASLEEGFLGFLGFLALLGCLTSHTCCNPINVGLQKLISQGFCQSGMRAWGISSWPPGENGAPVVALWPQPQGLGLYPDDITFFFLRLGVPVSVTPGVGRPYLPPLSLAPSDEDASNDFFITFFIWGALSHQINISLIW